MTVEERRVRDELMAATREHYRLKEERSKAKDHKYAAVRELARRVEQELADQYDNAIQGAAIAERAARLKVEWFEVEATRTRLVVPEGTVLECWEKKRWSKDWERTGTKGIVEVRTPDSPLPEKRGWSVPAIGDVGIRHLKKDGTPGLKLTKPGWGDVWSLVGHAPVENFKFVQDSAEEEEIEL